MAADMQQAAPNTAEPVDYFRQDVAHWLLLKKRADEVVRDVNKARDKVNGWVQRYGHTGSDGHCRLELRDPLNLFGTEYRGVMRQLRMRRSVNEQRVRQLGEQLGVLDRLFPLVPMLDESAIYTLCQEGLITEAQVDDLFDKEPGWACLAVSG